jgi:hypothetical protein
VHESNLAALCHRWRGGVALSPLDCLITQAPAGVKRRGSTFEGLGTGQYEILRQSYDADIDDDVLELDTDAYLRIRLEDADERTLVSLGWELERRRGVWLTSRWYWHDFRPEFHPGIGEEEWTRICG